MRKTHTLSILSFALAAALAAPTAFAQSATTQQAQDPQQAPPQEASQQQAAPTAATPAPQAAGEQGKKNWNDLDANGNGTLSATEAASMDSLAKVFPKADANGNGELTQDEYKTWVASNAKAKPHKGG